MPKAINFVSGQSYNVFEDKGSAINGKGQLQISENKNKGSITPSMDLTYVGRGAKDTPNAGKDIFDLPAGVVLQGQSQIVGHKNHFDSQTEYNLAKNGSARKGTLAEQIADVRSRLASNATFRLKLEGQIAALEVKQSEQEVAEELAAQVNAAAAADLAAAEAEGPSAPEEVSEADAEEAEALAAAEAESDSEVDLEALMGSLTESTPVVDYDEA